MTTKPTTAEILHETTSGILNTTMTHTSARCPFWGAITTVISGRCPVCAATAKAPS